MAWLLVVPLGTLGMLAGHELAYAITQTPEGGLHDYMGHLPQVALMLALFSFVGASFVERGERLAFWPFPTVALAGFVAQEHLERLVHDGALPLVLSEPVFLLGLALQSLVAVVVWLVARMLARVVGRDATRVCRFVVETVRPLRRRRAVSPRPVLLGAGGPRAPPLAR